MLAGAQMFDNFRFESLEVGQAEEGSSDSEAHLSLRVTLMPIDASTSMPTQAEPLVFTERSTFVRNKKGTWLYAAGDVRSEAAGFKDKVLQSEGDLNAMRKDVDYVQKLIKDNT